MGKKILVVDDNPDILNVIALVLETHNFDTVVAQNGKVALEILRHTEVDMVITDIIMPEIEGIGLIREIRKKDIPIKILAISGGDQGYMDKDKGNKFAYLDMANALGADQTLRKPFENAELINVVKQLLNE